LYEIQLVLFHLHIYKWHIIESVGRNMHIIYYGPVLSDIIVSDITCGRN